MFTAWRGCCDWTELPDEHIYVTGDGLHSEICGDLLR